MNRQQAETLRDLAIAELDRIDAKENKQGRFVVRWLADGEYYRDEDPRGNGVQRWTSNKSLAMVFTTLKEARKIREAWPDKACVARLVRRKRNPQPTAP